MLLITERRQIGHSVYAVSKSHIVPLQNPTAHCNIAVSRDENRYKRLLCVVDLTKDFFFSYSYNIMTSYQNNVCNYETRKCLSSEYPVDCSRPLFLNLDGISSSPLSLGVPVIMLEQGT